MTDITKQLAEALRHIENAATDLRFQRYEIRAAATEALAAHEAEQAAKAVPALYVGLIERLMRLSTRLGIAYEGGVEHFAASLEDRLYAICRGAESLLNSVATPPAPEAQQPAGQEQDERAAFEAAYKHLHLESAPDVWGNRTYRHSNVEALWEGWKIGRAALAQHREPLTDEDWRTRDSSDTDEGCAALHRAHGIGATTGEQR